MPRIAKWSEKSKCVKYDLSQEFKFYDDTTPLNRLYVSLNHYIDKTIEEALANGYKPVDDFSQFVSVKEVPKWEI
jgi:DNA-binding ferritin-like protein